MRRSIAWLASKSTATATTKKTSSVSSCALSVHFYHPKLGMKSHEILSRATAFLVGVDPPDHAANSSSSSSSSPLETMLTASKKRREEQWLRQNYNAEPASGPARKVEELGWLEFVPKRHRPMAHVVASSHVVSPWKWKQFYPQDWLTQINQSHVSYSLDVYNHQNQSVAKFACQSQPIHHPDESIDLAILHLKQEETALKHLQQLGIPLFQFTSPEHVYQKNDTVFFQGFQVTEEGEEKEEKKQSSNEEDDRVFVPFTEEGNLIFASPTRFLAKTYRPLPEGLCGGPVLLSSNDKSQVCGVVEGIVPVDHPDERMAGAASFLPSPLVKDFLDYAEHEILKQVVPETLYQKIVDLKTGKGLSGDSNMEEKDDENLNASVKELLNEIQTTYPKHQADALFATLAREKQEVMDILQRKGGDMDDIIASVRAKTRQRQAELIQEYNTNEEEKDMEHTNNTQNDDNNTDSKRD